MSARDDLLKAIRSGRLAAVQLALDAGATPEIADGNCDPGMPLGIACFLGHADIVRELVRRGARTNAIDNRAPTSPLSMAVRGGRPEIVRLLVELGAEVPEGMQTGLPPEEIAAARWIAGHLAEQAAAGAIEVEEIVMTRVIGTDTTLLEADAIQRAIAMEAEKKRR